MADTWTQIGQAIENYMEVKPNAIVMDWPIMSSKTVLINIISYILFIKYIGPKFMEFKKPYELTRIISVYNVFQIISCTILLIRLSQIDRSTTEISFSCKQLELDKQVTYYFWWTMCLKLTEFLETIFFVLRKKQSQITNLHVYHHVSTYFLMWYATKYAGVTLVAFYIILNSAVHILMYSYYMLANIGNKSILKLLQKIKKYITIIQMVQFTIILAHATQALVARCGSNSKATMLNIMLLLFPNVTLVYYMFLNFYRNSYIKKVEK